MYGKSIRTFKDNGKLKKLLISLGYKVTDKKGKMLKAEKDGEVFTAPTYVLLVAKIDVTLMAVKTREAHSGAYTKEVSSVGRYSRPSSSFKDYDMP
jgi:hypothetical protein